MKNSTVIDWDRAILNARKLAEFEGLTDQEIRVFVKTGVRLDEEARISREAGVKYARNLTEIQRAVVRKVMDNGVRSGNAGAQKAIASFLAMGVKL